MPPSGPKRVTRRFQELSETPQDPSKSPKSFNNLRKLMSLAFSPFLFRCASEASRWPQDGPRRPQEGPKRPPRRPQERPRAPQEGSKRAPRGYLDGPRGATPREDPPLLIDNLQDGPKRPSRAPKRPPREPQEGPKRVPRPPPRALRGPQDPPIELPEDHPPLLAHFGSLYVSLLAMSRQLSWAELLNGLAGLREA